MTGLNQCSNPSRCQAACHCRVKVGLSWRSTLSLAAVHWYGAGLSTLTPAAIDSNPMPSQGTVFASVVGPSPFAIALHTYPRCSALHAHPLLCPCSAHVAFRTYSALSPLLCTCTPFTLPSSSLTKACPCALPSAAVAPPAADVPRSPRPGTVAPAPPPLSTTCLAMR